MLSLEIALPISEMKVKVVFGKRFYGKPFIIFIFQTE